MKFLKLLADLSIGRVLILAGLVTGGYYFSYYDDGSSLSTQIDSIEKMLQDETNRRAQIEKVIKKEEEMRGNVLQLERNLEVVKSKIPIDFKDTEMSNVMNSAARASRLIIKELSIVETTQKGNQNPGSVRLEDLVDEVRFKIILTGSFDSFINFLELISREEKILKARNFTFEKESTVNFDDDSVIFRGDIIGFKQSSILSGAPSVTK